MKTKATNKGLQKLTESEIRINKVLALEQIQPSDLNALPKEEQDKVLEIINEEIIKVKGTERDKYIRKIETFMAEESKNQIWEYNHAEITRAISTLMQDNGRMPGASEIAEKTGLSRPTIYKHLDGYKTNHLYLGQVEQFRFMTAKVLSTVFKLAMRGDIGASKLYLNVMGCLNGQTPGGTFIQNQNNFIQINGTVLSQETVKQLNPEQLNSIEAVLKSALPEMKSKV